MNFEIGDKVICINNKNLDKNDCPNIPLVNSIYTVRAFCDDLRDAIFLTEIRNPIIPLFNTEPAFYNWRFIKIDNLSATSNDVKQKEEEIVV